MGPLVRLALCIISVLFAFAVAGCQTALQSASEEGDVGGQVGPRTSISLHNAYPSKIPILGSLGKRISQKISESDLVYIDVQYHEPTKKLHSTKLLMSLALGEIDAAFAPASLWSYLDFGFHLFGELPFGPSPFEHWEWIRRGNGAKYLISLYGRYNVLAIPCGYQGAAGFGWYKSQLLTVNDFQGKTLRYDGLNAEIMNRLGAKIMSGKYSQAISELRSGELHGANFFSLPYVDLVMGAAKAAPVYYYKSFLQPFVLYNLMLSRNVSQKLGKKNLTLLFNICSENIVYSLFTDAELSQGAIRKIKGDGTLVHEVPNNISIGIRKVWDDIVSRKSSASKTFADGYKDLQEFLDNPNNRRKL